MGLRDRLGRRGDHGSKPPRDDDPVLAAVRALGRQLGGAYLPTDCSKLPAAQQLLDAPREEQVQIVVRLLEIANTDTSRYGVADELATRLLRRTLPFDGSGLLTVLQLAMTSRRGPMRLPGYAIGPAVIGAIERGHPDPASDDELAELLRVARTSLMAYPSADDRRLARRIDVLLGAPAPSGPFVSADSWSVAVSAAAEQLEHDDGAAAQRLIAVAAGHGSGARPKKSFVAARDALVQELGSERAGDLVAQLLSAAAQIPPTSDRGQTPPETGDVLRGLATIAGATSGAASAAALAAFAIAGWRKVPDHGPQCRKAATAAVAALGEHPAGAGQLGRVKITIKQPAAREDVSRAIDRAAQALGIPRAEFEERVVPDLGLTAGAREEPLGSTTARIALDAARRQFKLTFVTAAGKALKSVPAEIRRDHPERLKELKSEVKDAQAMFDAQRLRLERLLFDDPVWRAADWRERYVEHGLVGPMARRLIWLLGDESAAWHDGAWRRPDATPLPELPGDAEVRLWHPASAPTDEVGAWREALERWEVTQPFKQAHREVYLLTPAEEETNTYSNRFASHVLRQHQMAALARARGWSYALQGAWDAPDEAARLPIEQHRLTAYFFVDRPWDDGDYSDAGVFTHVVTDQVRFENADGEEVPLRLVPERALSETLRDVDLFVGVASIGNDPAWSDRGADRRYDAYWTSYSFGELSAGAEVRKDVLSRLLPKLKLADRTRLEGRFLVVEGRLRTYKIHLGSGNILMQPDDQYLCIVPGRGTLGAERLFLPFEGDGGLSLILSKALMLADDDTIDDPTIVHQIRRRL
jgi:hypothetical protein